MKGARQHEEIYPADPGTGRDRGAVRFLDERGRVRMKKVLALILTL
jgi:hypothetical protein